MHVDSWETVRPPPPGLGGWNLFGKSSAGGEVTLPAFPCIKRLSVNDLGSIVETANAVGIEPDWLATIIAFESGCSPTAKNAAGSGATGLIQFMPDTAQKLLGTSTPGEAIAKLEAMSFPEQMKVVEKYLAPHAGAMQSLSDAYLAVLYPAFIGAPDSAVMGRSGSAIYSQNAGFDTDKKGYITKADIAAKINAMLASTKEKVATGIPAAARPLRVKTMVAWAAITAAAGAAAWAVVYLVSLPPPVAATRRRPAPAV